MKNKTNIDIIYDRLRKGLPVSTIGAVSGRYGKIMLRLGDIIFRLRNEGNVIKTIPIKNKTNSSKTAKYILEG